MKEKFTTLSKHLESLKSGDRYWFWFCPEAVDFPLLIEPFSSKDGIKKITKTIPASSLPDEARICTGISAISNEGIHQLACPLFDEDMLEVLARFVKDHIDEYPALSNLRSCRFLVVNYLGNIEKIYEQPKLWRGIKKTRIEGSIVEASSNIRFLNIEEDAWIWIAEDTLEREPLAVVIPVETDKKGKRFSEIIVKGRLRLENDSPGVRGIIRLLPSGVLLITTQDDLSVVGTSLHRWLAKQGDVLIAQVAKDEVISAIRIGGRDPAIDFTLQCTALEAMKKGEKYLFWFSKKSKQGPPLLLIHKSKVALKGLAHEVTGTSSFVRGTVRMEKYGLKFSIRKAYAHFLPALSKWVAKNVQKWPELQILIDARVVVCDREGNIVHRIKDKKTWQSLRGK